jgi:hypothetical protein
MEMVITHEVPKSSTCEDHIRNYSEGDLICCINCTVESSGISLEIAQEAMGNDLIVEQVLKISHFF